MTVIIMVSNSQYFGDSRKYHQAIKTKVKQSEILPITFPRLLL